jgi:hypothetical protein
MPPPCRTTARAATSISSLIRLNIEKVSTFGTLYGGSLEFS